MPRTRPASTVNAATRPSSWEAYLQRTAPALRRLALPCVVFALGCASNPSTARSPAARSPGGADASARIALTFDDLPVASTAGADLGFQRGVTDALLTALERHGVQAVGFVNEGKLELEGSRDPGRVELLRRWLDAGHDLGNHGYAHLSLHRTPLAEFQADVLRGERVTRRLLAERGREPRWFRHPFLHTGRDQETRAAFHAFLEERGYRVAPVTIDNYDYRFAAAYDRAPAEEERRRVVAGYLEYMEAVVAYYEQQSQALLGRALPHVLLLHANPLNAVALDRLLTMLEGRGYAFIPLETALADPAYALPDEYTGAGGITWLHRWALTAGKRGAFFAGEPEVPGWIETLAGSEP